MKILDIINQELQQNDICPKCGKHKNGVLKSRSLNFSAKGNSHFECVEGYQTKEEANLCTCGGE
jgi:hypothetical protein